MDDLDGDIGELDMLDLGMDTSTNRSSFASVSLDSVSSLYRSLGGLDISNTLNKKNKQRIQSLSSKFNVSNFMMVEDQVSTDSQRSRVLAILRKPPEHNRTPSELRILTRFLLTIKFFNKLSVGLVERLAAICKYREYKTEQVIYKEGEDADEMFIIASGSVATRVYNVIARRKYHSRASSMSSVSAEESDSNTRSEHSTNIIYAGGSFGDAALQSVGLVMSRVVTKVAHEPTEVLVITSEDYNNQCVKFSEDDLYDRFEFCRDHLAFVTCTEDQIWQAVKHMKTRVYPKNHIVVKQGDESKAMFFVIKGVCRVVQKRRMKPQNAGLSRNGFSRRQYEEEKEIPTLLELSMIDHKGHFGERGLLDNAPRSTSVFCDTKCVLIELSKDEFFTSSFIPKTVRDYFQLYSKMFYGNDSIPLIGLKRSQRWEQFKSRVIEMYSPGLYKRE